MAGVTVNISLTRTSLSGPQVDRVTAGLKKDIDGNPILEGQTVPEIYHLLPQGATVHSKSETRNPKPGTRNPEPETLSPDPGTRDQAASFWAKPRPEMRDPNPGTRSPKYET